MYSILKIVLPVIFFLMLAAPAQAHTFIAGSLTFTDGFGCIAEWHLQMVDHGMRFTSKSIDQILTNKNKLGKTNLSYQKIVGTASIEFSGSPEDSANVHNALVALGVVNNYIVQPGEVFSLNEATGLRDVSKGYIMAYAFSGNKVIPAMGGGVCRVSSLLYQAALDCGLQIVERHPHSMPVKYAPDGRDATVWYGVLDFKFRNNFGYPIMIKTEGSSTLIKTVIWELHDGD